LTFATKRLSVSSRVFRGVEVSFDWRVGRVEKSDTGIREDSNEEWRESSRLLSTSFNHRSISSRSSDEEVESESSSGVETTFELDERDRTRFCIPLGEMDRAGIVSSCDILSPRDR
jgi:hypothetical protein